VCLALGLEGSLQSFLALRYQARAGSRKGAVTRHVTDRDEIAQVELECDAAVLTVVETCLKEGCSVEAMDRLEAMLTKDEHKIKCAMKSVIKLQAERPIDADAAWTMASYEELLAHLTTLHAQLRVQEAIAEGADSETF